MYIREKTISDVLSRKSKALYPSPILIGYSATVFAMELSPALPSLEKLYIFFNTNLSFLLIYVNKDRALIFEIVIFVTLHMVIRSRAKCPVQLSQKIADMCAASGAALFSMRIYARLLFQNSNAFEVKTCGGDRRMIQYSMLSLLLKDPLLPHSRAHSYKIEGLKLKGAQDAESLRRNV